MRFVKNVTTGETYRFVSFVQKSVSGVTYVDATTHAMVKDDKGCTYYFPINEIEFLEEKKEDIGGLTMEKELLEFIKKEKVLEALSHWRPLFS